MNRTEHNQAHFPTPTLPEPEREKVKTGREDSVAAVQTYSSIAMMMLCFRPTYSSLAIPITVALTIGLNTPLLRLTIDLTKQECFQFSFK